MDQLQGECDLIENCESMTLLSTQLPYACKNVEMRANLQSVWTLCLSGAMSAGYPDDGKVSHFQNLGLVCPRTSSEARSQISRG